MRQKESSLSFFCSVLLGVKSLVEIGSLNSPGTCLRQKAAQHSQRAKQRASLPPLSPNLYRRKTTPWTILFKDAHCVPTQPNCSYLGSNANRGAGLQGLSETHTQHCLQDLCPETLGSVERAEKSISVPATQRPRKQLAFSNSRERTQEEDDGTVRTLGPGSPKKGLHQLPQCLLNLTPSPLTKVLRTKAYF